MTRRMQPRAPGTMPSAPVQREAPGRPDAGHISSRAESDHRSENALGSRSRSRDASSATPSATANSGNHAPLSVPARLMTYARVRAEEIWFWAAADARRLTVLRYLGVVLSVGLTLLLIVPALRQPDVSQRDFVRFYHAALLIKAGSSPYNVAGITGANLANALRTGFLPLDYVYPPFFGELLIPFTVLPTDVAFRIWVLILLVSVVGALALLSASLTGRVRWPIVAAAVPLALALRPMRDELIQANVDVLLLLLMCASLWAYQRGYIRRSALFLALAVAIKPFFGILLFFYLWKRAYRLCAWAAGLMATLVLVPFIPLGVKGFTDWMMVSSFESGPAFVWVAYNQSPYGVAVRLFSSNPYTVPVAVLPWLPRIVMFACAAATLFVLARLVSHDSQSASQRTAAEYVLVLMSTLLISPLAEQLHLVVLAAPLLAIAVLGWPLTGPARLRVLGSGAGLYALFALPQVYSLTALGIGHPHGLRILLTSIYLWGVVGVFILLAYILARSLPARSEPFTISFLIGRARTYVARWV